MAAIAQKILNILPPATRERILSITRLYRGIPLPRLPEHLQRQVRDIFTSISSSSFLPGQQKKAGSLSPSTQPSRRQEHIPTPSSTERGEYWEKRQDIAPADRVTFWETQMNTFLAPFLTDPTKKAGFLFLQNLLRNGHQPHEPVPITANSLYTTFLAGEGGGNIEFFVRRIVSSATREEIHHNRALIVELAKIFGEQTAKRCLPLLHSLLDAQEERKRAAILGTDLKTGSDVVISQQARQQALYAVGANGTGKTTLLRRLILHDITHGLGVCLIEPHGDLTRHVIAGVPENRLKDVIYLDMTDSENPFGLNLFQCDRPSDMSEVAKTASFVMHVFEKVWDVGPHTPQLAQVVRNVTRTLIENPGTAFSEIPLLLWDETVRETLVAQVTNSQTQLFWSAYNRKSQRDKDEYISSTINKCDAYLNEPMIANIVSQAQTTIDFRKIMDEGKIFLVNLSPQLEEMSRLIGAILIGKLLLAAFSRTDTPEEKRKQFNLYCDEFQRFATSDFATLISEARKFRIATTLSHQVLSQLDEANRTAAATAGNLIVFRVSGEDAKALAKSFDTTPTREVIGEEPIRAPVADVVGHLVRRGHTNLVVAKFTTEYLVPLDTLLKKLVGHAQLFEFGCVLLHANHVIEGQRLVNDCLASCMRTGRADSFIHPWALFTLGGAADAGITHVFYPHLKRSFLSGGEFEGFEQSANRFGRADFLENKQAVEALLKQYAKKRVWDSVTESRIVTPASSFVRMLRSLRQTMEILAREPIMVDTGQYQPKYQNRTFSDMEGEVANFLANQPNFQAKVKLLSGEHVLQTKPAPLLLSDEQVSSRIIQIKREMRLSGYTRAHTEVEREIRSRQERLRNPAPDVPPPTYTNDRSAGVEDPPPTHF